MNRVESSPDYLSGLWREKIYRFVFTADDERKEEKRFIALLLPNQDASLSKKCTFFSTSRSLSGSIACRCRRWWFPCSLDLESSLFLREIIKCCKRKEMTPNYRELTGSVH